MDNENTESRARSSMFAAGAFWLVGLGVAAWVGVWISTHDFSRQLKRESRSNQAVAAIPLPHEKVKIEIKNSPKACLQVENVSLDDGLTIYWRNVCDSILPYTDVLWQQIAPDGTVLFSLSTSTNYPSYELRGQQRGEFDAPWIKLDARAVRFVVRVRQQ